ncbi:MAG: CoA transferase, partial [Candidatus Lokiarchaeota archaeon]|nr:CoA transferase [Candidatus Lokiarchaeota archaeon]
DDKFMTVGAIEFKFWQDLCRGLGRDDLKSKQMAQGEKKEWVFNEVQKEFLKKTQQEWYEIFKDLDACVMPIKNFTEACEDPQIKARNMVCELSHPKLGKIKNVNSPIKMSRTPPKIRFLAPKVGQHTKEILKDLGYEDLEIKKFKRSGVI